MSCDVVLLRGDGAGPDPRLDATLDYAAADPYAVVLTLRLPSGRARWWLARDLLADGLTHPAGVGDVRLVPDLDDGRAVVRLDLRSPTARAVVTASSGVLADFLAATWAVVPHGRERDHVDLDALALALVEAW